MDALAADLCFIRRQIRMSTCEWCGKDYIPEDEEAEFVEEYPWLSFSGFRKNLCASCAIQAIEEEIDGVYFEQCEKCGREFDLFDAKARFMNLCDGDDGAELTDYWKEGPLCADCACDVRQDEIDAQESEEDW